MKVELTLKEFEALFQNNQDCIVIPDWGMLARLIETKKVCAALSGARNMNLAHHYLPLKNSLRL
jgi:hypothetical protein